jgi:hypothetical protein
VAHGLEDMSQATKDSVPALGMLVDIGLIGASAKEQRLARPRGATLPPAHAAEQKISSSTMVDG